MRENDFSRLEINLPNCLENYRYFRSCIKPETRLLVLVKANAYGHGAVEFASMMEKAGADYLAVAYPVEGVELRKAGIWSPILVLTAGTDFFEEIIDNALEPGIPNLVTLKEFCEVLESRGLENFPVHIKLDTGMHRLGFMTSELPELTEFLKDCKSVRPQYQFDMVRLGIGIYGVSALPDVHLAPVASFKCKILQIKHLSPEDGTIGYGRHGHIAPAGTVIATIPVGYADGVDRRLGNGAVSFMLNGHRVPTIGNICMDMCMLDITGVPAEVGDTVTVFGEEPTASEIADILGTIPYEIFTSVPRRIERVIVK